jgi:hypothetical protein
MGTKREVIGSGNTWKMGPGRRVACVIGGGGKTVWVSKCKLHRKVQILMYNTMGIQFHRTHRYWIKPVINNIKELQGLSDAGNKELEE